MSYRLLFVEDEEIQQKALKEEYSDEIEAGTYELLSAYSGEEALKIIDNEREKPIDLIILGLRMPAAKIDGYELIRILSRRVISIKIIVVTGYQTLDNLTVQERKNIVAFLVKNSKETETENFKKIVEVALRVPDKQST